MLRAVEGDKGCSGRGDKHNGVLVTPPMVFEEGVYLIAQL